MKRLAMILIFMSIAFSLSFAHGSDKKEIIANVDEIVTSLNSGKKLKNIELQTYKPDAFVMKDDGTMLVHPSLSGENLMEKAPVIYKALMQANAEGTWVEYLWRGKTKKTYARKTKDNLIVGSEY